MAFDGNESKVISLADAMEWTGNYQDGLPQDAKRAHFYGKTKLMQILNQTGCQGIRIYRALDDLGVECLVLVGADADEQDMVNGIILEKGLSCPPRCSTGSGLNH